MSYKRRDRNRTVLSPTPENFHPSKLVSVVNGIQKSRGIHDDFYFNEGQLQE